MILFSPIHYCQLKRQPKIIFYNIIPLNIVRNNLSIEIIKELEQLFVPFVS